MMTLREVAFAGAPLRFAERSRLAVAAAHHPVAWPRDEEARARLSTALRLTPPPLDLYRVPMLAASPDGALGSLFTLWGANEARRFKSGSLARLIEDTKEFLCMQECVLSDVSPLLPSRPLRVSSDWLGRVVAYEGRQPPTSLHGRSFHLAYAAGYLSWLLNLRPAIGVAATAAVDFATPARRLTQVKHLPAKLRVVADWALAVDTVIVPSCQEDEAKDVAAKLSRRIEITPAETMGDALDKWFPALEATMEKAVERDRLLAERLERRVFHLAVTHPQNVSPWKGLRGGASVLTRVMEDPEARLRLEFSRATFERHERGVHSEARENVLQALGTLRAPLRVELIAHLVQDAAGIPDAGRFERAVALGRSELPAAERDYHPSHLKLLGALGRAYAAWLRLEEAKVVLEKAIEGWFALDQPAQASMPLCERVRVAGLASDAGELETVLGTYRDELEGADDLSQLSRAYFAFAVGRAWALRARWDEARAELERDLPWNTAPPELRDGRLRWLAFLAASCGHPDQAEAYRHSIVHEVCRQMAQFDAGIDVGASLRGCQDGAIRVLLHLGKTDAEIARYCPY
jgi:tetratricopeptide (TPR) repeat protein